MNLRHELRGVSRTDLVSAVLLVPTLALSVYVIAQDAKDAPETQVQETQVPDADGYKAVWDWCGVRWPYREDLQEACRWGAYEMLPKQGAWENERTKDA